MAISEIMRSKRKTLAHLKKERRPQNVGYMYIQNINNENWVDKPIAFIVEWSEISEHDEEPDTYSVYVLSEDKAKSIFFDLVFGLRNSESWSQYVPHDPNRKVEHVSIEVLERHDDYSTNSLYTDWLDEKAKSFFLSN